MQVGEIISDLAPEDQQKVRELAKQINIDDSQMVIQYGVEAQKSISEFSDQVLSQIRAKDTGETGEILSSLMLKMKDLDVDSLSEEDSFISKIPFLGSLVNSSRKFIAQYDTLSEQLEKIIDELHKSRMNLIKDITLFDNMYKKNLEYFRQLNHYILAGELRLKELQEKDLPELQKKSEASGDPVDAQKYQDFAQMVNRFEKKIHDLKLSKMLSLQTGPQIRLIQNANQVLVEKIQSSILNTIPLWKNQMVIAIGLLRQKKALSAQQEVTKTTNDLLAKNSEMLKTGTIEVAKEAEKGIIELETLKKINNDLISTIDETIKIQEEGKKKRKEAEGELSRMEDEIKSKLLEIR
ncbi:MAG: toxic anion resistance protein [Leptospiraceae bacterium]|nr:toxic anion resistance protein [Leptospiraceae bacterium]